MATKSARSSRSGKLAGSQEPSVRIVPKYTTSVGLPRVELYPAHAEDLLRVHAVAGGVLRNDSYGRLLTSRQLAAPRGSR